ncbi:glycosyltransferase [Roseisalinus antarcticus]|uniref:Putative glycosyltransferase EpsE n=1 Tax=Roseisalinus antarcticus TaxID=254357 RepID=A0A1Y5TPP2_9RHOB|nr:glycosyltransferase [Roseisalinus antarcticus]SLN69089.1 Putative glycosyltransferase EpsE [Roseisalinus antarcticus]
MCTYNGAAWLPDQLESFLAQTRDDWTLWVSDDGSTDDTAGILDRFDRDNPGRLERRLTGPGRGSAANYLQMLAHPDLAGSYVALSDQDDVWRPEKLARAMAVLTGVPEADDGRPRAYAAAYYITDRHLLGQRPSAPWLQGPSLGNALVQNIMSGHTTVLNPAALDLVRRAGAPEIDHHDWWIYLLMAGTGADIHIDPEPMVLYRQHADSVFGARQGKRALARRLRNMSGGTYAGWIKANVAALETVDAMLTPEARRTLAAWRTIPRHRGPRRMAAFRALGIHRQSHAETMVLNLASRLGWA